MPGFTIRRVGSGSGCGGSSSNSSTSLHFDGLHGAEAQRRNGFREKKKARTANKAKMFPLLLDDDVKKRMNVLSISVILSCYWKGAQRFYQQKTPFGVSLHFVDWLDNTKLYFEFTGCG